MKIDRNGLLVLDREDCLRLLRESTIGRVAVSIGALPAIFPVNFVVVGDGIVFRSRPGTKLEAALNHTVVAFEVDAIESFSHSGWSVMVTGHASVVAEPDQIAEAERLPLLGWAVVGSHSFVRIEAEVITGRRLDPVQLAASTHRYNGRNAAGTCPDCGAATTAVGNGDATNFLCPACGHCRHYELGFVSSVDPATCPGCGSRYACKAFAL